MDNESNAMKVNVWPCAGCVLGDDIWIFHGVYNMLFKYSIEDETTEFVCSLHEEQMNCLNSVASIIPIKDGLYIIPSFGKHIHFYNLNKRVDELLPLPDCGSRQKFCKAVYYDKKVLCIPANFNSIISIDPSENSIIDEFSIDTYLRAKGIEKRSFSDACIDSNGIIYAVFSNTNKVIKYDARSKKCELLIFGDNGARYSTIQADGDLLYLSDVFRKVINIYKISNYSMYMKIDVPYENYRLARTKERKILVDSMVDGKYMIIDGGSKILFETKLNFNRPENAYRYTFGVTLHDGKICRYYYDRYSYELKEVDGEGFISEKGKGLSSTVKYENVMLSSGDMIRENSELGLKWMLSKF